MFEDGDKKPGRVKRSPKMFGVLVLTVVILICFCLSIPLVYLYLDGRRTNRLLIDRVNELEASSRAAQESVDRQFTQGKDAQIDTLVEREAFASRRTFEGLRADIESDPRWQSGGLVPREITIESIKSHFTSIRAHLDGTFMFEMRFNGVLPASRREAHGRLVRALKAFRDRVVPRLARVSSVKGNTAGEEDLTALKAELIAALDDLIRELGSVDPAAQPAN